MDKSYLQTRTQCDPFFSTDANRKSLLVRGVNKSLLLIKTRVTLARKYHKMVFDSQKAGDRRTSKR